MTDVPSGSDVNAWLASGLAFGRPTRPRQIDTHAASVFLQGDRAWKLKKPVRLGYLDFSTPARRHDALEAELRLNRRSAPALYIALHKIARDNAGGLLLDGPGDAIDWLLEMRRFPDDALLADVVEHGGLSDQVLVGLADDLVALHDASAISRDDPGAERFRTVAEGNARRLACYPTLFEPERVHRLTDRIAELIRRHAPLMDQRAARGRVRRGHGDLHLGNLAMIGGKAVAFDCLEFDEALATSDVLYDIAFLLMDLWTRGLGREANLVLNRYLDRSPFDEDGFALLPLFMSARATIRAHVLATLAGQPGHAEAGDRAAIYLEAAERLLDHRSTMLVAIGGLSGSGKSTVARAVAADIGCPPGARILRSDVLRKRSAGVAPETALDASTYTRSASEAVYAELLRLAAAGVAGGGAVIADAVFGLKSEKAAIAAVAAGAGCSFHGFWLDLDDDSRVERISSRGKDASDATATVALRQSADPAMGGHDWTRLAAARPIELIRRDLLGAIQAIGEGITTTPSSGGDAGA